MPSITTGDRCGSRTRQQHSPATTPRAPRPGDRRRALTSAASASRRVGQNQTIRQFTPPAVRQVTGWITGLPSNLDPDAAVRLQAIRQRCPELDAAVRHVAGFARMIKDLSGDENTLTKWMGAVDADLPALRSFTAGLRRDLDAVVAGLTLRVQLRRGRRHRQPGQAAEGRDVRTRQTRPAPQTDTARLKQL